MIVNEMCIFDPMYHDSWGSVDLTKPREFLRMELQLIKENGLSNLGG